jgi:hypothetical protein
MTLAAALITTAAELDALPTHAVVTDNQGAQWKKFWGRHGDTWSFRCLGGYNRDRKPSAWLAQYAPLTRVPDDETESAAVFPPAADPGDVTSETTRRYRAEGLDAVRRALAGNGPITPAPKEPPMSAAQARRAVDNLTRAIALLTQAGTDLPQAAFLTRAATDSAETALMIARNELSLAER